MTHVFVFHLNSNRPADVNFRRAVQEQLTSGETAVVTDMSNSLTSNFKDIKNMDWSQMTSAEVLQKYKEISNSNREITTTYIQFTQQMTSSLINMFTSQQTVVPMNSIQSLNESIQSMTQNIQTVDANIIDGLSWNCCGGSCQQPTCS